MKSKVVLIVTGVLTSLIISLGLGFQSSSATTLAPEISEDVKQLEEISKETLVYMQNSDLANLLLEK
ncbi:hypothetical protein STRDD10_01234 [Streptococcus sp. DD10]|uniref:hypothetical protein n=1 Tax=Streptococcus sp. DD10 TaxID=1777878 RepID=UPI000791AA4D|nr:hypothetical protein [Streptococcus sp. DD10]KXT74076.1 hypothetical protein STRDD10_01234 [Streptococcus sp. DD10]